MKSLVLNGDPLTLAEIESVALQDRQVTLAQTALERMVDSRNSIDAILSAGHTVYGVNTGFGRLSDVRVAQESIGQLQVNLVRSHAGGSASLSQERRAAPCCCCAPMCSPRASAASAPNS